MSGYMFLGAGGLGFTQGYWAMWFAAGDIGYPVREDGTSQDGAVAGIENVVFDGSGIAVAVEGVRVAVERVFGADEPACQALHFDKGLVEDPPIGAHRAIEAGPVEGGRSGGAAEIAGGHARGPVRRPQTRGRFR